MNYTDLLGMLNKASAFDLYRMRSIIDHALDQPQWMMAVQARLSPGMVLEYFDPRTNAAVKATLLEMRRKTAVVQDLVSKQIWVISYAAINLEGADVEVRDQPQRGLSRHSLSIGDLVGFRDRDQQERCGRIVRLNDRTVTLDVDNRKWRVSYTLLHRVVETEARTSHGRQMDYIDNELDLEPGSKV